MHAFEYEKVVAGALLPLAVAPKQILMCHNQKWQAPTPNGKRAYIVCALGSEK